MTYKRTLLLFFLLACRPLLGHDHWIDAETFCPKPGEKVKLYICSGHNFPKSNFSLSDQVIFEPTITGPGCKTGLLSFLGGSRVLCTRKTGGPIHPISRSDARKESEAVGGSQRRPETACCAQAVPVNGSWVSINNIIVFS